MGMRSITQKRNGTPFTSSITAYFGTKPFGSTIQRMICDVNKTLSTHGHIPTLCYSRMRGRMKKSIPTHIGMPELLEFSMLMLSTMARSRHRLKNNELISFGFDGLGAMFHFKLGGKPNGCIVLDF